MIVYGKITKLKNEGKITITLQNRGKNTKRTTNQWMIIVLQNISQEIWYTLIKLNINMITTETRFDMTAITQNLGNKKWPSTKR